jgi:hypothetical protein
VNKVYGLGGKSILAYVAAKIAELIQEKLLNGERTKSIVL